LLLKIGVTRNGKFLIAGVLLTKAEKYDLNKWKNKRDPVIDNPEALHDSMGFATQVATYTLLQDLMLSDVKYVMGKYHGRGVTPPSDKQDKQLVALFRRKK
jgi:hypothetical protein